MISTEDLIKLSKEKQAKEARAPYVHGIMLIIGFTLLYRSLGLEAALGIITISAAYRN